MRTKILAPVYELMKEVYGVDMSYVRINMEDLGDNILGQFRPNESYIDIAINEDFFSVVTDDLIGVEEFKGAIALLQATVIHELNHVAQHALNKAISIDTEYSIDIDIISEFEEKCGVPYAEQSVEIDSRLMEFLFIVRNHREFAGDYMKHVFSGVSSNSQTMNSAIEVLKHKCPELLHELLNAMNE